MFVQISPSEPDLGETLSSLNFATRARGVELGQAKRQIDMGEIQKLKLLLDKGKQESRSKDEVLRKLQENFQTLEDKFRGKDQICRNHQEKLKELESQLESKTELCTQMEKQLLQISQGMKRREEICSSLQQEVNELQHRLKLKECEHVDSKTLQLKIEELENKLKQKTQEFELQMGVLPEKIKELEEKLKQRDEVSESMPPLFSSENSKATPSDRKTSSTTESNTGRDCQSLSLKSSNRSVSHESVLLKGTDSLREVRRKRDLQSGGIENSFLLSASSVERKLIPVESNKTRHIDPSKAFARVTRSTKPFLSAQRFISGKQVLQVPGVKETNTRTWLR
ncbi:hypothetical protein U1Q18_016499 [Sarracenia purpurea var. burkii]